jgi:predicted anti-sigma-YlaC factor YlaD
MTNDRNSPCEHIVDALDDYLDGTADTSARASIETHLATCTTCPALVADVRAIRGAARTLAPIEPPPAVWRRVQARVRLETSVHPSWLERLGLSVRGWRALQPIGAVAGLVLVVASLTWIGARLALPTSGTVASSADALAEFQLAEAEYTDAIVRLQDAADAAAPRLDAFTSATLESSIDDIDLAIGDARDALAREPGNALSQENLLDALGSKVALLQDTVALAGDFDPSPEGQNP